VEEIRSFKVNGKEIFFNYDETKSKEEKNKKNGSQKKAHRGQSVRYRSWCVETCPRSGAQGSAPRAGIGAYIDCLWFIRNTRLE